MFSDHLGLSVPPRKVQHVKMTGIVHAVHHAFVLGALNLRDKRNDFNSLWLLAARYAPQILQKPDVQDLEVFVNKSVVKWIDPESSPHEIAVVAVAPDPTNGNQMTVALTFRSEWVATDKAICWDQFVNINELGIQNTTKNRDMSD